MRQTFLLGLLSTLIFFSGCASGPRHTSASAVQTRSWFLDPSTEFANYRTYAFLQATAVRYEDPLIHKKRSIGIFNGLGHKDEDERLNIAYTDELIWRVLQDEMGKKRYAQVAPSEADILVIYYGGPRPQTAPDNVRIVPHSFDSYFALNELQPQTFWVDVIDNKRSALIFRGWDNQVFTKGNATAENVIEATKGAIGFFPSTRH